MSEFQIAVLATLAELYALRGEWNVLLTQCSGATIFQTWEWVTTWYEHFAPSGALSVVTVRDRTGALVGVAPCSASAAPMPGVRLMHLLGRGNYLTEYVDAVVHPEVADDVSRAIFDSWDCRSAGWDLLVLPSVPADSTFGSRALELGSRRGYRIVSDSSVRVTRELPDSWETFYRSLRKSMKQNVNNYVNRLHREGREERMVIVEDRAELDAALDTFLDLHRRRSRASLGRPHADRFGDARREAFLRALAPKLLERGWIWPCLLYIDGAPVAAMLALVHRGRVYTYYSGFDPEWAFYGVMTVLTRRCIEHAIAQGCRELDHLVGNDQEKLRWGGRPGNVLSLTMANPRLRSRTALAIQQAHHTALVRLRQIRAPRSTPAPAATAL